MVQQMVCTTSLPTPADCIDMPYSPALLLDGCFDASITDHADFRPGCEWGFDDYFGMMYQGKVAAERVFVNRLFTLVEVVKFVRFELFNEQEKGIEPASLSWRASFVLGWLSALFLVQPQEALAGLDLLMQLVASLQGGVA